jgi:hypothetical protein
LNGEALTGCEAAGLDLLQKQMQRMQAIAFAYAWAMLANGRFAFFGAFWKLACSRAAARGVD